MVDARGPIVVKVGGSLFDMPDFGRVLHDWLGELDTAEVLLVPGGGATADVVRAWDRQHRLGEEASHWLALGAMALNAQFLATLLTDAVVVAQPQECSAVWRGKRLAILDGRAFARAEEARPGALPHCWAVTSDSIAARAVVVLEARRLILLKSVTMPEEIDWTEAARRGWVDRHLPKLLATAAIDVCAINLRARKAVD